MNTQQQTRRHPTAPATEILRGHELLHSHLSAFADALPWSSIFARSCRIVLDWLSAEIQRLRGRAG